MNKGMDTCPVVRLSRHGVVGTDQAVAREFALTIKVNGRELVSLVCSPMDLEYLVAGVLLSEGMISDGHDIREIVIDQQACEARVQTEYRQSAPGANTARGSHVPAGQGTVTGDLSAGVPSIAHLDSTVSARQLSALVKAFNQGSRLYSLTHGVHSAALCENAGIVLFTEDIGRRNAIDRVFGRSLVGGILTQNRILVTSCRVSSEVVLRVARRGIPILASISTATDAAIRSAGRVGMTLICQATETGMDIYTNPWRITGAGGR